MKMRIVSLCLATFVFTFSIRVCPANPTGGTVVGGSGNGTISGSGTPVTTINQRGNRIIINWTDFSIGAGEVTRFVQPSATSWALNRIISGNPSLIYGSLQANGHVMVLNQNGILVGAGAKIDTKGFVASTLDIHDSSFMKGGTLTLSGNSTAGVRNDGTIQALGGDVFLIGNTVENNGTISAPQGTVGLAAGSSVRLVPAGNERISVLAGNANGAAANGVHNVGTVEGASAELKAAGGNIYALAINNEGAVRANSIVSEGGHVYLRASGGNIQNSGTISANKADGSGGTVVVDGGHNAGNASTVVNSGTIEARGDAAGTKGGRVEMTGDNVGLFDHAVVDVSGNSGGGVALIGGDTHGANPQIQNASAVFASADSRIFADSLSRGDGGRVVVWSDGPTRFYGGISARGGDGGGDGGFVETSGRGFLDVAGAHIDAGAAAGAHGNWLMDPHDITIDNQTTTSPPGYSPTFTASQDDSHVNVGQINGSLSSGTDVTISTGSSGTQNGDITVNAAILRSGNSGGAATLTLNADPTTGSVIIGAAGSIKNTSNHDLNVVLSAGKDVSFNGAVDLGGGGSLSVTAGGNITQSGLGTINSVSGPSTFTISGVGPGNILLGSLANNFDGRLVTFSGPVQDISFRNTAAGASFANLTLPAGLRNLTVTFDNAGATIPALTLTGNLTVSAGGGNLVDGGTLTVAGNADFTTTGGGHNINLGTLKVSGTLGLHTDAGDNATVVNNGAINFAASSVGGNLTATASSGDITESGNLVVSGNANFTAAPGQSIVLDNSGNTFNGTLDFNHSGVGNLQNVTVVDTTAVNLQALAIDGDLHVTAGGNITESGVLSIGGTATFAAGANDITLDTQLNHFNTVAISSGNNVRLKSVTSLDLGASSVSGNLTVASTTGDITDSAAVSVTGSADFTAGPTKTIVLDSGFSVAGTLGLHTSGAGGNATVVSGSGINFANSTVSGTLSVTAGGDITESGALTVLNGPSTFTINGVTGNVLLGNANDFGGQTVTINATGGGALQDVSFRNTSALAIFPVFPLTGLRNLTLGFDNTGVTLPGLTLSGNLSVTAGGAITESGALIVNSPGATATFDANGNNITLDTQPNDFSTVLIASGNDVRIGDINGIDLGASSVSGNLTVSAGGNITESGALIVNGVGKTASFSVSGPADILLGSQANDFRNVSVSGPVHNLAIRNINANAAIPVLPPSLNDLTLIFNNAAITLPGLTLSGNLIITAGGDITQSGAILLGNPGQTATFSASGHNIVLNNNANDFNTVAIGSGNNVTLVDANRINLGASSINGNLNVTALNGPITQTGSLVVNGAATFTASGAGNDIILTDSGNDFNTISLFGGNANIHDANGLDFGASTLSGNLFVTAHGTISQSGALTFTTPGTIASFDAGLNHDINLGLAGNDFSTVAIVSGNNVTLGDANALDIGASTISGNFNVTANGFISQSGAIIANGVGKTATFNAGALNNIFLNNPANDFTTVAITAGHDVILQDVNSIDLGASTVFASFNVTAHGDITQSGALNVNAGSSFFTIDTATGDVLLGSQANDFGNQSVTISAVNGGSVRDVTFRNINAAAAFPTLPTFFRNLSVQFDAAPIIVSSPFTLSGDLSLNAGGPIFQTVPFNVNGSTTLTAGGNDISLTAGNDFGGAVSILSGNNVTLFDVNGLTVGGNVNGNLATTAGGPIAFNALTVGGNLTAVGSGLSDNANVSINGTSSLNAGGGDISFTHADNFGGAVTVANANNVTLNDINALTVGGNVGGNLTTTAGGPIAFNTLTVGGNLNANGNGLSDNGNVTIAGASALNAGGADISFTHNDNFVGAVTVANANNVTLNDINALTVGGTVGGNLTTTAGGPIAFNTLTVAGNLSASGAGLGENGDVTVTGTSALNGGGGDISFTHNDNFVGVVTVANANNVTLNDINALTVGGTVGGNLTASAGGPLAFNTLSVGGNLTASGNGVSDNGDVTVTGASALNGGGADISFTHNDNFVGAVTVANAHNVTLNDINALTVGGSLSGNLAATAGGALAFNTLSVGGNLTANGNGLSDNGNVSIAGTSALNAGGGDITFTHANDFGGAVSIANAHNVTLNDINAINLGASTVSGSLTVVAGGNITQSGDLTVANAATFATAGGNSIILDQSGNTFNGPVNFASTGGGNLNNVTVVDTTAFDITGIAVDGTFSLTAGGPVTQSGNIIAQNLGVTSAGSVTLNGANQVGTVAIDAQGAIQYNNVGSIAIGSVNGVNGLISHNNNITVTTANGDITVNNTSEPVDVEAGNGTLTFTTGSAENGITIAAGASVHGEGGVTFTADNMDIAGTLSSGAGNMVLQPLSLLRPLHFGPTDNAGSLNFSQTELDHITSHDLTIGNVNTGPISGSASIFKPVTVDQLHILGGGIQIDVQLFANQLSLLAGAILPVPRVEVASFSGAAIDLEKAAKIMEPDAIGTLFLQVPFVPVEAKKYKVEDVSKWTTGRTLASGTTAGPQTPQ